MSVIEYSRERSRTPEIVALLRACDDQFTPPLSQRTEIASYAAKMNDQANRFEAWSDNTLVGLVAGYIDTAAGGNGFITNVCVHPEWKRRGIAAQLMQNFIDYASSCNLQSISLEVSSLSAPAVTLYEQLDFKTVSKSEATLQMKRWIRE